MDARGRVNRITFFDLWLRDTRRIHEARRRKEKAFLRLS